MERTEVRIGGFGGQGVVLSGVLLGQAALNDGKYAVQQQSYGAEARGGAARSEVIVSDEPVLYPEVISPGVMAVLSQAALDRYVGDLLPDGILVVDADLVSEIPEDLRAEVHGGRFSEVAGKELGRPIVANMVMLGFLGEISGVVSREGLEASVASGVPKGTEALNLKALKRGMELVAGNPA
ncbi:MAG: 2-oxoacid:acceptor oxidoreductase family protein [Candidatus Latescibacteria bacterium]|jgi:2-oxoglutarate ferredoxin oxidoreductase subunit gamma|nr:2-oxoacid:acceptor oxidoreductase family protein [Candidatus Latescibacterota bacterium]